MVRWSFQPSLRDENARTTRVRGLKPTATFVGVATRPGEAVSHCFCQSGREAESRECREGNKGSNIHSFALFAFFARHSSGKFVFAKARRE